MGMRENLINLIRKADKEDHESRTQDEHYCFMVDKLMESGVTIPVRCKECVFCIFNSSNETFKCKSMNGMYRTVSPDDFCSYGERRTDAETMGK